MRKLLMATAATLGTAGGIAGGIVGGIGAGTAMAQTPAPNVANPSQGQLSAPYGAGPATNNNNNAWGIANTPSGSKEAGALSTMYPPNVDAVPTPGSIVIRLNGRVEVNMMASFTNFDKGVAANGTPNGYKVNPLGISTYARIYPGFDGVAANGLRYGAAAELRDNYGAADRPFASTGATGGPANSPSANSSTETIFVRRAFSYIASDRAGIVRFGQADGVIGLFDNCVFTSQCFDGGIGNINGGDFLQSASPQATGGIPFVWLAQAGSEYSNNKIVYLSPQYYGFDFGVQYAPNMGNAFQNQGLNVGCTQAGPTCISVTSGNDPTRWYNQVGTGLRFQRNFQFIDLKAYGFYETAGKEDLTTSAYSTTTAARLGTGGASAQTLRYDNLNFYKAGVAVTAFNLTAAVDYIGGAINGQLAMRPTGGAPMNAILAGLSYAAGPWSAGIQYGVVDSQGDARLVGLSQRHEYEVNFGGAYKVAPGLQLVAEYTYQNRHQGGFDFSSNSVGAGGTTTKLGTTRDAHNQGMTLSTVLTW
jgi:hypothetical protein